jgi:hypothetical protein
MGYRKLSARPRHHAQAEARSRILKKYPHALGCNCAREGDRQRQNKSGSQMKLVLARRTRSPAAGQAPGRINVTLRRIDRRDGQVGGVLLG